MIKQGNRGKAFEALIVYSFNTSDNCYVVRLRESIKGTLCLQCKTYINLSNKSRKQPFDYIAVYRGRPFALEAKSVHGVSFPIRNIKEHQVEELLRFEKDGSAHVLLEFIPKKGRPRRCFMIPILEFKKLLDLYSSPETKRESVPLSKIEELCREGVSHEVQYGKNAEKKAVLALNSVLDKVLETRWAT